MTDMTSPKPWERQPDEPVECYARFHIYLLLGPSRNLTAAYQIWANGSSRPPGSLNKEAAFWRWTERAFAYDQDKREEEAALEQARAAAARQRRLQQIEKLLDDSVAAIDRADLKDLSKEEARSLLPTLRHFFACAIELQRREMPQNHAPNHDNLSQNANAALDEERERLLEAAYPDE